LLRLDASVAFDNAKNNPYNRWGERGDADSRVEPIAKPAFKPTFRLVPGESVFTIGSCFARHVEQYLEGLGYDIPMRNLRNVPGLATDGEDNPNIFNNYGVPSILNELEWAIDPAKPFDPRTCLFETSPGQYIDLHLTKLMKPVSLDEALMRRTGIKAAMASVLDCRVIIITLGLVEVWWDTVTRRYLNMAPLKQAQKREPGRFELHVMSHAQCVDYLERVVALLKRFGRADHRILLTVSPVPLGLTLTDQDVMVANTYSKSVLRVAAQEIWYRHSHIDYFPSYESVMLSDRAVAWKDDMRHVTPSLIGLNVSRMVAAYTQAEDNPAYALEQATIAEREGRLRAAARLYTVVLTADPAHAPAAAGLGRCVGELGSVAKAEQLLLPLLERPESFPHAASALLKTYRLNGVPARFKALLPKLLDSRDPALLPEIISACFAVEDLAAAATLSQRLVELAPRKASGYESLARIALSEERWGDAEAQLKLALGHNQSRAMTYTLLAQAMRGQGRNEEARDARERADLLGADVKQRVAGRVQRRAQAIAQGQ